ncbi:MAG: NADP-dependent malic enzyme [Patescibacteria group bacterium]|jgi:malate dehydrogenase (oxaloacetate-decarboxylating)
MTPIEQAALDLHRKYQGKLEVRSKVPLKTKQDMSLAYTPGVGKVSQEIARDPQLAYEYTLKKNTIAIISDGSAVLGLGNLGPLAAIPVMEGKALLFKELGGVDAFPICLDTQDTEEIIRAVKQLAPVFGGINLEDISSPRCFEILERLRNELSIPVIHDDQQGTAVVVLAALINALKVKGQKKESVRVVVSGAGAAGLAITNFLLAYGFINIVVCDSQGAIYKNRDGLNPIKEKLAKLTNLACLRDQDDTACIKGSLADALKGADIFIGVSVAGALKPELIKLMNPDPIIFAMANPTPEIMPDEALAAGALIVATGRSDFANQINNVLAFPGIFRGALDNKVVKITDKMLTKAAENIAARVVEPKKDNILPSAFDPGLVATVANAIK